VPPPRRRAGGGRGLALFSLGVYLFLYAPLFVLAVFSFNEGRLAATWEGFTLDWYRKLLHNRQVLSALRNSLIVGTAATLLATAAGTAAALAFHRWRFRRQGALDALVTLPIAIPEIVLASSLLLLFAGLGLRLGFLTVVLAHLAFCVSYAVVVVKARLAGFDRSLEEAAMDLGAGPAATFFKVTLPGIAPGVLAAALLCFALSIDDYVITSFVAGVGSTTLPVQIYSMVRSGVSPEINAVSTLLLVATSLLLLAAHLFEQGRRGTIAVLPALLGLGLLGAPFALAPPSPAGDRVLNLYIWSNFIYPETIRKFEERQGARVQIDLFDGVEAMLAKVQAGNSGYDVICPTNYAVPILAAQGHLLALDRSALPHFANLDPRFLDPEYDPGNRHTIPYLWGTCGIAYRKSRVGTVDSWSALWDPRWAGRVLMLDDTREAFTAALKRLGRSVNTTDPGDLARARALLVEQRPLVRAYDSAQFDDKLVAGDVWLAQGWSGQIAKAMARHPDVAYVLPREGTSMSVDTLAILADSPHSDLAHAFLDFVLEAEIAAEIARTTYYSSPNRAAVALLPEEMRTNPAIFPPEELLAGAELIRDLGETTVLYDRLWTEVKTSR